jgi:Arc/MetJ-type ribon-helix-helix transcriptional regulator
METEKITINLGAIDLGKIDLLVDEGFYGNRTDLIRTAIRSQLERHEADMNQTISRKAIALGAFDFSRADLQTPVDGGEKLAISVIGLVAIANDVTPDLARAAIESIWVRGMLREQRGQRRPKRPAALRAVACFRSHPLTDVVAQTASDSAASAQSRGPLPRMWRDSEPPHPISVDHGLR